MTTSEESDSFENVTHSMDCVLHWCHALVCMCVALEPCIGMCVCCIGTMHWYVCCIGNVPLYVYFAWVYLHCRFNSIMCVPSSFPFCSERMPTGLYYRGTDSHAKISSTY